jgi:hypothetical protein
MCAIIDDIQKTTHFDLSHSREVLETISGGQDTIVMPTIHFDLSHSHEVLEAISGMGILNGSDYDLPDLNPIPGIHPVPPCDPQIIDVASHLDFVAAIAEPQDSEMSMIQLQSIVSQRATAIGMMSNMLEQLNESTKEVMANMGDSGGSSPAHTGEEPSSFTALEIGATASERSESFTILAQVSQEPTLDVTHMENVDFSTLFGAVSDEPEPCGSNGPIGPHFDLPEPFPGFPPVPPCDPLAFEMVSEIDVHVVDYAHMF